MSENLNLLITVKTYPHPSLSHDELVCTAGITEDGDWIRLYPIDFRYRPYWQQFDKYQWIEVEADPNPADNRPESYRPDLETLKPLEKIETGNDWYQRRKIVLQDIDQSIEDLEERRQRNNTSLGIIKPDVIYDLSIDVDDKEWDERYKQLFEQTRLFGEEPKPLEKIPYKFRYQFECNDERCNGNHSMSITDWEAGQLYLNERERLGSEREAAKSVRTKFLGELCADDRETYFYVGTTTPHRSWIILGVFWPPKTDQQEIF